MHRWFLLFSEQSSPALAAAAPRFDFVFFGEVVAVGLEVGLVKDVEFGDDVVVRLLLLLLLLRFATNCPLLLHIDGEVEIVVGDDDNDDEEKC